jgi:PAS domain S-box-containing protein
VQGYSGRRMPSDDELEELRRIAKFFHSIVETIPDMVFVKDADDLRFVLFNRAGEELLGVPRADMLGKNDYDFFPTRDADFFRAKDMETLRAGGVVEIPEEVLMTRAHGKRLLHTKKIVISDADGSPRYLLGISQDITARRTAEIELDTLRSTVAAAVVHDLRAPLQSILFQLEVLAAGTADESKTAAAEIRHDIERLSRLTNDLLDSTRVAIEDLPLASEIVDLAVLVPATVDAIRARVLPHPVVVRTHEPLPPTSIDPARLEQILQNLLENAAKYSVDATPIEIEVTAEDDGVCIRVIDRGLGIDPAELPRVFDRFYRSKSAHPRGPGFGLGLFITKGLVIAQAGRIDVHSELGKGSVFRIWFPPAS